MLSPLLIVDISVSWMNLIFILSVHPTSPSSFMFFKTISMTCFHRRKKNLPSFHSFVYILNHTSSCALCFVVVFVSPPSILEGGMAHWKFPPLCTLRPLHPLSSLSVSPASRGHPPCLLLFQEQIHISIKRRKKKEVPPASAAQSGSPDISPSYQVHRGFHLSSHTVSASRRGVGIHVLYKMSYKHT